MKPMINKDGINTILFNMLLGHYQSAIPSPKDIIPEHELVKDLGADSLDIIELIMTLEDAFNVIIPDGSEENWKTVGDIYRYFEQCQT